MEALIFLLGFLAGCVFVRCSDWCSPARSRREPDTDPRILQLPRPKLKVHRPPEGGDVLDEE